MYYHSTNVSGMPMCSMKTNRDHHNDAKNVLPYKWLTYQVTNTCIMEEKANTYFEELV